MNIEVANRLQELRKKNGYSQEELAAKLGVSRQAVSKWERSESSPDTDNLICLAQLYEISLDELLKTDKPIEEIAKENADKLASEPIEDPVQEKKDDYRSNFIRAVEISVSLFTVAGYLLIGFLTGMWHPGWLLFFAIPVIPSLAQAIINKSPEEFLFPVFIAGVYLTLGFTVSWGWHPGWVIFLAIPAYYAIIELIFLITKRTK
jgi:transcriptional regulator with XRE-family HTH domain